MKVLKENTGLLFLRRSVVVCARRLKSCTNDKSRNIAGTAVKSSPNTNSQPQKNINCLQFDSFMLHKQSLNQESPNQIPAKFIQEI